MIKYWIKKNLLTNLMSLVGLLIFLFFISHIFLGDRSLWRIFKLNNEIISAKEEYNLILKNKNEISSTIELLRNDNLDPDYISELSHKILGLIAADQIVIDIKNR